MPIPAGGSGTTLPDWAPDLTHVASYVPGRTLVVSTVDGSNVEVFTFDNSTRPTSGQVIVFIGDAVAWVQSMIGPTLDPSLSALATAVAAVWAAAAVERGYPERESANEKDAQVTAAALFKQADDMLAKLAARNDVLVGENPAVFEVAPVFSFPCAPSWGDYPFL